MIYNSKNHYSQNSSWLFRLLQGTTLKSLASFLLIALFFINVLAGVYVGHQPNGSKQANFYALDDVSDLVFSPAERTELSSYCEVTRNSIETRQNIWFESNQHKIVTLCCSPEQHFVKSTPTFLYSSSKKSPSSPRPPPVSAVQA